MDGPAARRAVDRIAALSAEGKDVVSFWRACGEVLAASVPHYLGPCWFTLDPASLIMTSHFQEGLPVFPAEWAAQEYTDDGDVHHLAAIAGSRAGISTLYDATGGRPDTSPRWHANMAFGADQEVMVALRTRDGQTWGVLSLYREPDREPFDGAQLSFLRKAAPLLADGARRGLLVGEATDPEEEDGPALIVLDRQWRVSSASVGADRWLRELPDAGPGRLPPAVLAVAGHAAAATGAGATPLALARVRTRSGMWVVLHGVRLIAGDQPSVAVVIEPVRPDRLSAVLMAAHGLTEREQDLTRLVLQGYSTSEIAERLVISPHTVQQHLKSVFDKVGVHSRRELAGRVFLAHYEPRLRDNERRTARTRPMRGGPMPGVGAGPPRA